MSQRNSFAKHKNPKYRRRIREKLQSKNVENINLYDNKGNVIYHLRLGERGLTIK